jgi:hypothetical protein
MTQLTRLRPGLFSSLPVTRFLTAATFLAAASIACNVHTGSGIIETETREIGEVTRIEACCGFEVDVQLGSKPSAKVTTDQELLDQVVLTTDDDTLVLSWKDDSPLYQPSKGVKIQLTLPELSSVSASGGSRITAEAISGKTSEIDLSGGSTLSLPEGELSADDVSVTVSGSSHLDIMTASLSLLEMELSSGSDAVFGTLNSTSAKVNASGGSRLEAQGIGDDLIVTASGGSEVILKDLAERRVKVDASGGSEVSVDAREELAIEASGGSQVTYRKEPPAFTAELIGGSTASPQK